MTNKDIGKRHENQDAEQIRNGINEKRMDSRESKFTHSEVRKQQKEARKE
jgi:hypothetical protein